MGLVPLEELAKAAAEARQLADKLDAARRELVNRSAASVAQEVIGVPATMNLYGMSPANLIASQRRRREKFLHVGLFGEPAWDILLHLYGAGIDHRQITISKLSEAAGLAGTTALRWVSILEAKGYVVRSENVADRRCAHIALSERGRSAMTAYFQEMSEQGCIKFQVPGEPIIFS